jgi:hypothetical protein
MNLIISRNAYEKAKEKDPIVEEKVKSGEIIVRG